MTTSTTPAPRNTGIIAIDPATTDAVGTAILVLVDEHGVLRAQWQAEDLEHLPDESLRRELDGLITGSLSISNSPGFTR